MPNEFFRWEEEGALVHHCPVCKTPLTNRRCQLRCLGTHVEWCKRYHCQLFKNGCSSECFGCRGSDEQRHTRYRQIAELVKEVREIGNEDPLSTPKLSTFPKYDHSILDGSAGKTSKKDRKEAKSRAKAASREPVITARDVERVGHILHPEEPVDEEEFEKALLMDKTIENNVYYHAGTANTYKMRARFISQERSGKSELKLSDKKMDQIIAELLPNSAAQAKSKKERDLIARLRKLVDEDFTHDHGEEQQTMMRKAGFWRWANREAYNRLVENGRIWDWKSGGVLAPVAEQQVGVGDDGPRAEVLEADAPGAQVLDADAPVAEVLDADTPGAEEPDHDVTDEEDDVVVDEGAGEEDRHATDVLLRGISLASEGGRLGSTSSSSTSRATSASSASRATGSSTDDSMEGYTTVGKKGPAMLSLRQTPILKFSANGGLGHMSSRTTPRTPMSAFSLLTVEDPEESGDEEEDDDSFLSRTPCKKRG